MFFRGSKREHWEEKVNQLTGFYKDSIEKEITLVSEINV